MSNLRWALPFVCVLAIGCSGQPEPRAASAPGGAAQKAAAPVPAAAPAAGAKQDKQAERPVDRKIIRTAQIELVVDNFDKGEAALWQLLKSNEGYMARSEVHGTPGTPRSATWTVRVPVAHFDDFLASVATIGELHRSTSDSSDVTDAYYDLQAHIKNDETREEGLRKLYLERSQAQSSKLEDLLTIDRALSEVRGKIDAEKGQLQRWDKETAFSTATISMHSRHDYVAPVELGFGGQVGGVFQQSVGTLVGFGKALILAVVAVAPWSVVFALLGIPIWWTMRRRRMRLDVED
jgi:hypothetical protein